MGRLPLIGIEVDLTQTESGRRYSKCYETYFDAVSQAGGAPVLVPPAPEPGLRRVLETLDGLVVPGGDDFSAEWWGETQRPCERYCASDERRLEHGRLLMTIALELQLPYLGICYGAQLLNLVRGGSLIQDIPDEIEGAIDHRAPHPITIEAGTLLATLAGATETTSNSRHHQSIRDPGRGLRVSARTSDGVVEAIEADPGEHPFLIGIQWHGEELGDQPTGAPLFEGLVAAAKEYAVSRLSSL